jgi:hypothetical protein
LEYYHQIIGASFQGIQKGIEYQFRVIAISKAGKSDPSLPSRAKEARAQRRKPPFLATGANPTIFEFTATTPAL